MGSFSTKKVARQIQGADRGARQIPLCWWHDKGCSNRREDAKGVDEVSDSCGNYYLTISIKKTEVVYQPAPGKPYKEATIIVKCHRLQVVDKFTYLGSTLSRVVHIDDEVNARIAKASAYKLPQKTFKD